MSRSTPCPARALLAGDWPEPVRGVLRQQIEEPAAELQIRASIPAMTPIAGGVSQLVRDQYEEMPYPRWTKPDSAVKPVTFDEHMRAEFPQSAFQELGKGRLDVLIAGCGTGRQPIEFALKHPGCDVLAVDLSLASLSYAKRKASELGLDAMSFAQADIVLLPTLDRTFDLIDCVGVLHHLGDPMAGWRGLVSMLRPGGMMGLGFYSALARRDVNVARDFIAARGYKSTAADIRRCRQDMMQEANPAIRRLLFSPDFYTTSECRDLIFHIQEHQLTLPAIKAFLAENNLAFLGFRIHPQMREQYRRRFPSDAAMADLDNWHKFETENPTLFGGMYIFWVQKPKA